MDRRSAIGLWRGDGLYGAFWSERHVSIVSGVISDDVRGFIIDQRHSVVMGSDSVVRDIEVVGGQALALAPCEPQSIRKLDLGPLRASIDLDCPILWRFFEDRGTLQLCFGSGDRGLTWFELTRSSMLLGLAQDRLHALVFQAPTFDPVGAAEERWLSRCRLSADAADRSEKT